MCLVLERIIGLIDEMYVISSFRRPLIRGLDCTTIIFVIS